MHQNHSLAATHLEPGRFSFFGPIEVITNRRPAPTTQKDLKKNIKKIKLSKNKNKNENKDKDYDKDKKDDENKDKDQNKDKNDDNNRNAIENESGE